MAYSAGARTLPKCLFVQLKCKSSNKYLSKDSFMIILRKMYLNFLFFYPSKKQNKLKKKTQEENLGTFQRKIIYL